MSRSSLANHSIRPDGGRRGMETGDNDVKINLNKDLGSSAREPSAEAKEAAAGTAKPVAETAKLAADLEDLRQMLLRRQADFDNYRKRIEKERFEDAKHTNKSKHSLLHFLTVSE